MLWEQAQSQDAELDGSQKDWSQNPCGAGLMGDEGRERVAEGRGETGAV